MADKLWDPAAPQPGRTFEGVIAASVQLSFSNDSADGEQAVQLELASIASGRLTAVPQTCAITVLRPQYSPASLVIEQYAR
jgi:hypothetical protein